MSPKLIIEHDHQSVMTQVRGPDHGAEEDTDVGEALRGQGGDRQGRRVSHRRQG